MRAAQHDRTLQSKLQRQLQVNLDGSLANWRRITQAQCLWSLALFINAGLMQGQTFPQTMTPLIRTMCQT